MKSTQQRGVWLSIRSKARIFCKHCTLHGVYYLSEGSCWMHGIWALIISGSLGLCCFLSHMIWDKYAVDPTLTVVETTHYSTADIPFPAVTVCDPEAVYLPNTENFTKLLLLRGYNHSQITEFYQSFTNVKKMDYVPSAHVKKMHLLLDDLGYPFKTLLDMLKKPCDMLLLECHWRSQPHNCSEMFRIVYTIVGYCCQFDVPYYKMNTAIQTNFVSGVQPTEALEIEVKMSSESDLGLQSNVLLYVFDQKDRITLIDIPMTLKPAAYYDLNVYLWAIDSSPYVKMLSLQTRKCILDTDTDVGVSFYKGCMTRLILKKAVEQCRCLPFQYTARELKVDNYVSCTWDRLICIYQEVAKAEAGIRDIIAQNECYQRCDYVEYETEVELVASHRKINRSNEMQSRVTVHFTETTCMKYRREVLYTWDQMLANLGGIFGLCLGGSIISVIEIVWFLIDILITAIKEAFRKEKVNPQDKIFVVKPNSMLKQKNTASGKDFKKLRYNSSKFRKSSEFRLKFVN